MRTKNILQSNYYCNRNSNTVQLSHMYFLIYQIIVKDNPYAIKQTVVALSSGTTPSKGHFITLFLSMGQGKSFTTVTW